SKLCLGPRELVLDIGCGTGRWADCVIPHCSHYHGTDVSPGLVEIAQDLHGHHSNARFSVCPAEELSLSRISETDAFARIISFGVLMYLNDEEALQSMHTMAGCAASCARILLREPVGIGERLTIKSPTRNSFCPC